MTEIQPQPVPGDGALAPTTFELLSVIDKHGTQWPAALTGYGLDAVGDAIDREIRAGNLRAGAALTEQGRRWLIDVRARRRLD